MSESPEVKHKARSAIRDEDGVRGQKAGTYKKENSCGDVDPAEVKMHRSFHIFVKAGGHAHYVEAVENLAAARKRLKQVAQNASGDCFLYSIQDGIVELIVRPESPERLQKAPKLHVVQGRRAG